MEQIQQFLPFILMFVVIYFFMIRPQQKKIKQEKEFEAGLKVGDRIITKSGFHGKIAVIETMSGKLKIERSAISLELTAALNKKA